MKPYILLLFIAIITFSCKPTQEETLPMKVAHAYGFKNFDKVKAISYTWHVQPNPEVLISRTWKWNITSSTVYFSNADTAISYSLKLPKEDLPDIDAGFINDKYWLMYPFQLAWDSGYDYEVEENIPSPIGGTNSTKLTIIYNQEDGYTPGDAYDLYLDPDHKILEWVFRKSNGPEGRAFTWEEEKEIKGLTFATMHRNDQGEKFIWFTDIEVD